MLTFLWGAVAGAEQPDSVAAVGPLNQVEVLIQGVDQSIQGPLLVYLYVESTWLKPEKAFKKAAIKTQGKQEYRWTLKGVPPGEYAVQVTHDEDSNGKLSMGLFGPSEGVGVSRYVPTFIPSFDKAKFKHAGTASRVKVQLDY